MPKDNQRRPRTEIIIATAATIVSICAMVTTVYQTYILRQQQHAAVWPRLQLMHSYWIRPDSSNYRLMLQNNGIGPAIIRNVSINYRDSACRDFAELSIAVAIDHRLPDSLAYRDYSDLLADMVIPQQETLELLYLNEADYISSLVEEVKGGAIYVAVQYESLYGESWEVNYPKVVHRRID